MTVAARFKQVDVTRAVKGAQAAGLRPTGMEIDPNGKIILIFGPLAKKAHQGGSWDDV